MLETNKGWLGIKQALKMRGVTMTELETEVLELISENSNDADAMANYLFDEISKSSLRRVKTNLDSLKKKLPGQIKLNEGIYSLKF